LHEETELKITKTPNGKRDHVNMIQNINQKIYLKIVQNRFKIESKRTQSYKISAPFFSKP